MSGDSSALIELGVVGAPFGVRGWVKLRSYTEPPDRLLEHRSLQLRLGGAWRAYRSRGQRPQRRAADREADRESTIGTRRRRSRARRSACRAASCRRARAKDFYRADLIGCEVVNLEGARLGVVQHFVEIPAHALMVVRGEHEYWVPAVPQHLQAGGFAGTAGRRGLGRGGRAMAKRACVLRS